MHAGNLDNESDKRGQETLTYRGDLGRGGLTYIKRLQRRSVCAWGFALLHVTEKELDEPTHTITFPETRTD